MCIRDRMIAIWNEVVEEGIAFPQEELLTIETGRDFFGFQTYTAVADEMCIRDRYNIFSLTFLYPLFFEI